METLDKPLYPMYMEKLYKNLILCGEIDFYCLGCRELFHSIPEVEKHIRWERHRKFVKNERYLERYKKDCIYMVRALVFLIIFYSTIFVSKQKVSFRYMNTFTAKYVTIFSVIKTKLFYTSKVETI